jgi:hypothetical protein
MVELTKIVAKAVITMLPMLFQACSPRLRVALSSLHLVHMNTITAVHLMSLCAARKKLMARGSVSMRLHSSLHLVCIPWHYYI